METDTAHYYIGKNDCKKATCNRDQEFEKSPYCLRHALEEWARSNS